MKFTKDFTDAKQAWVDAVVNNEAPEKQSELYNELLDAMLEEAKRAGVEGAESYAYDTTADGKLNAKQRKFFNAINADVGYADEELLPQETIDNIFNDMVTEHPLLAKIGLKNAGLRLKFLKSETSGVAVWGKIFGDIKGQLDATFSDEESISNKLTAFIVIPKDLSDFGPAWIESFVRLQIQEAFSVALELAFLTGDGKDKPVGLNRDVSEGVSVVAGVYPEKTPTGTLTFASPKETVKELTGVFKHHSIREDGRPQATAGLLVMVINPLDAWDVRTQYTHLNAQGVYVTALPFNLDIVESVAQKASETLTFVQGRYDAYVGGGVKINKYDQTLALEDLELYVSKMFAFGKAKDDKTAATWSLAIDLTAGTPEGFSLPNPYSKMTVEELKVELDSQGIEYDPSVKKADLLALLGV